MMNGEDISAARKERGKISDRAAAAGGESA